MNSNHELASQIDRWFAEDIGEGDHSSLSTIPAEAEGSAQLLVKAKGILAGMRVAKAIFRRFDPGLSQECFLEDGAAIRPGDVAFRVHGSVRSLLQCERLVLNLMQRMSGIATTTRQYAERIEGTGARILDTRKTTPGLRFLEKEAVKLGGGDNHRFGLYDMIMIKDNHIDFAGGIEKAIDRARAYLAEKNLALKIEVETRSVEDVGVVLHHGGVDRIMLDNFSLEQTRQAVERIDGRIETESSGSIDLNSIRAYAECGVDYISVGALTHQIRSLDLSLKASF